MKKCQNRRFPVNLYGRGVDGKELKVLNESPQILLHTWIPKGKVSFFNLKFLFFVFRMILYL